MRAVSPLPVFAAAAAVQATAGAYGQCGGIGYSGASACGSGYTCTTHNNNPPIRSVLNLIPGRHRQFEAAKNAYGVFAFQGDTLVWSAADIARPNLAAWLVCEGREVFVNTGAFLYDTPAGCFDHTIHSYGVVALVIDGGRARI
ncbi:hypothetical protein B0T25DRAFT_574794 [Lasiosphaeria hispida]|uniref:CBM1 domain-containing protein n=1 Tax=Lasiosphaeria hispida TaxID=260671 RepID=A0AAJ0M7V0_9PEZI|nr:hypothetical protein B0T25DRAFT_574794 [Lasiosphaeria hispida]